MGKEIGAALAEIRKISTTVDGGMQVTLNFGSEAQEIINKLLSVKLTGGLVSVGFVWPDLGKS